MRVYSVYFCAAEISGDPAASAIEYRQGNVFLFSSKAPNMSHFPVCKEYDYLYTSAYYAMINITRS